MTGRHSEQGKITITWQVALFHRLFAVTVCLSVFFAGCAAYDYTAQQGNSKVNTSYCATWAADTAADLARDRIPYWVDFGWAQRGYLFTGPHVRIRIDKGVYEGGVLYTMFDANMRFGFFVVCSVYTMPPADIKLYNGRFPLRVGPDGKLMPPQSGFVIREREM